MSSSVAINKKKRKQNIPLKKRKDTTKRGGEISQEAKTL